MALEGGGAGAVCFRPMSTVLAEVGRHFGLRRDPDGGVLGIARLGGVVEGQRVACALTSQALRLEGLFEPALDLGLDVSTRHVTFVPTLGRRLSLDDPSWDQELSATADEPERAARLFGDGVRGAVLGLNATNLGLSVDDERVTVLAPLYDVRAALEGLPRVARVAALVAEARAKVPVAGVLKKHSDALRAFGAGGAGRRLAIEETPLSASGELRDASIELRCARTGRAAFAMEVRAAALEPAADIGLLVRRESMLDRARTLLGGQDLRTGDAAFDPAFLVQAAEADRAAAALDADVRALLLDLRARFDEVTLTGATLALRGPAARVPAEDMAMVLEAASTVVARVARASGAVPRGAYR